jgi:toxin-antitoxin system PIN domain toxin
MPKTSLARARYLLDLNCLIALADPDHDHHSAIQTWFKSEGKRDWGVCPLTEAGLVRVTTNPSYSRGSWTTQQAVAILADFAASRGYRYWPITDRWTVLTRPFSTRIVGHQQVTDAYLLGLAIQEGGVLVTFDRGIEYLAGPEFSQHVLLLK